MQYILTKSQAELLLPEGETIFEGTSEEFQDLVVNAYWVLDDAPYPYWERERLMKQLSNLASKHGFNIETLTF